MIGFVIMRDRVTYARRCVTALEAAGLDVVIVDHDSDWPEAMAWVGGIDENSSHGRYPQVAWKPNQHPRDLWAPDGVIRAHVQPGERFVVTDCDVIPDETCPANWLKLLGLLLDDRPAAVKAGLGLRTDDLPEHFEHRAKVQAWEAKYQPPIAAAVGVLESRPPLQPPAVWADIDTTLALYRGFEPFQLGPAIRTTAPYLARHLPWYEDSANLTDEQAFYYSRTAHGHWRAPDGYNDTHGLGG